MKLSIENFAKIKRADIELNGITIIAGENDSGKSTVGKVLATVFSGFHNVNEYSRDERYLALAQVLLLAIKTHKDSQIKNIKESLNFSLKQVDLYVALSKYELQDVKSTMLLFRYLYRERTSKLALWETNALLLIMKFHYSIMQFIYLIHI